MSIEQPEHSAHGASACKRWWNCPGSIRLSAGIPNRSSIHAEEGTAAHKLAEACLLWHQDAAEYIDRHFNGFAVDNEMADAVQIYLDHVRAMPTAAQVEVRFNLADIAPPAPMYGTCDAVSYDPDTRTLHVADLKYGKGVQVYADGNPQLRYYALGALLAIGPAHPVGRVVASIVQPRAVGDAVRAAVIEPDELAEWSLELIRRAEATLAPDAPLHAGEWCKFCPAAGQCPAQASAALAVAQVEFSALDKPAQDAAKICLARVAKLGPDGCGGGAIGYYAIDAPGGCPACRAEARAAAPVVMPDVALMSPDQISAALHLAPQIEAFIHDLRAAATVRLQTGQALPGWKLVPTRPSQSWHDDAMAEAELQCDLDFTEAELFKPRQLVSPAQARERLKNKLHARYYGPGKYTKKAAEEDARVLLAALIRTASSGVNLVPDADARPALPAAGSEFLALPAPVEMRN